MAWQRKENLHVQADNVAKMCIRDRYKRELGEILKAIKPLSQEAALDVIQVFQQNIWISAGVFLAGVLTFLLLMIKFNKLTS